MNNDEVAELLKTQKSLTEWLDDINHTEAEAIRFDDGLKRERLKRLNEVIGLPYDKPTQFECSDMVLSNSEFKQFLKSHGKELCALRLMPKKPGLSKLRMRGKTIEEAYEWYKSQDLDSKSYRGDFVPHADKSRWSTIFIVNKHGIQGEIIYGGHHQLTQGFHDAQPPMVFRYDFKKWALLPHNSDALSYLKNMVNYLLVTDKTKRDLLAKEMSSTFHNNYLEGYFETSDSVEGTWFIDYSTILGEMYNDTIFRTEADNKPDSLLHGQTGSSGKVEGMVKIVDKDNLNVDFPKGGILVCAITTPDFVPLMQKASAIVTDQGGILSHAAIVARELKKPCIVGTEEATKKLKDGDFVTVDATQGTVILRR